MGFLDRKIGVLHKEIYSSTLFLIREHLFLKTVLAHFFLSIISKLDRKEKLN